jgi:Tfp pilus assembly protein PilE
MKIKLNHKHGATLLELLILAALVMTVAAFIAMFGIRAYEALRRYIDRRDQEIRREIGEDEQRDQQHSMYYHTGTF